MLYECSLTVFEVSCVGIVFWSGPMCTWLKKCCRLKSMNEPWMMRLQAFMGICSLAKDIQSSFKQSLHCHKLLVQIQILRVLCLRLVVVFLSPKKALKCVLPILLFNCRDLWCALHRLRWERTTKKTGNFVTFFGMHHCEKFQSCKLFWKELYVTFFWLGVFTGLFCAYFI